MYVLMQVEMLNKDNILFDEQFNDLKEFYIFDDEKEFYDFIKIHPGIILLLNEFKWDLEKFFPKGYFELKIWSRHVRNMV